MKTRVCWCGIEVLLNPNLEKLPQDFASLKGIIANQIIEKEQYELKLKARDEEIERLQEFLLNIRRQHFAKKSETVSSEQLGIFNEAEVESENQAKEQSEQKIKGYTRKRGKRKPLPDNLPREEVIIELSEDERICPHDGSVLNEIGEETSEQLEIIPARLKVIRTIRKKYACPSCDDSLKTAPLPVKPIPKSIATPGLLSFIAVSKYVDGLPLYRQEKIFERYGIELSRSTMGHWLVRISQEHLQSMINMMEEDLLGSDYLNCDETTVQVLKEDGKKATTKSYMWVRSRASPKPIILFEYDRSRSKEVAKRLLEGFKGYLQVDGYAGYNAVCDQAGVIRVGCMSHCRRKFFEVYKSSKKKGKAGKALKFIKKLYKIEESIKCKEPEERYLVRQEKSGPILDEFRKWLDDHLHAVPPQNLLGQAITYAHNEWANLIRYIEDGRLSIDNNFVENQIRPFAIGRKNWLFSDSVAGAKASATIYSIMVTALANGLEPYTYFRHLMTELPTAKSAEQISSLLPYNIDHKILT